MSAVITRRNSRGGRIKKIFVFQKLPLINHPFSSMATTRLGPVRNYQNKGLTPITEISVEETQTSIDTNEASPLLGGRTNGNGSCVSDKSQGSNINSTNRQV